MEELIFMAKVFTQRMAEKKAGEKDCNLFRAMINSFVSFYNAKNSRLRRTRFGDIEFNTTNKNEIRAFLIQFQSTYSHETSFESLISPEHRGRFREFMALIKILHQSVKPLILANPVSEKPIKNIAVQHLKKNVDTPASTSAPVIPKNDEKNSTASKPIAAETKPEPDSSTEAVDIQPDSSSEGSDTEEERYDRWQIDLEDELRRFSGLILKHCSRYQHNLSPSNNQTFIGPLSYQSFALKQRSKSKIYLPPLSTFEICTSERIDETILYDDADYIESDLAFLPNRDKEMTLLASRLKKDEMRQAAAQETAKTCGAATECVFFKKGRCLYADKCAFIHPRSADNGSLPNASGNTSTSHPVSLIGQHQEHIQHVAQIQARLTGQSGFCQFYNVGKCIYADQCVLSHGLPPTSKTADSAKSHDSPAKSEFLSKFFETATASGSVRVEPKNDAPASVPVKHDASDSQSKAAHSSANASTLTAPTAPATIEAKPVLTGTRFLAITGLPPGTRAHDIADLCSLFGKMTQCKIIGKKGSSKLIAYATMESIDQARQCVQNLHDMSYQNVKLNVQMSKKDMVELINEKSKAKKAPVNTLGSKSPQEEGTAETRKRKLDDESTSLSTQRIKTER